MFVKGQARPRHYEGGGRGQAEGERQRTKHVSQSSDCANAARPAVAVWCPGSYVLPLSLFGGASSEVRRCSCSVVDESCSSLAGLDARCVSFYRAIYLSFISPQDANYPVVATEGHAIVRRTSC
eukprot:scaffold68001_cov59-Phaeocystis_antarctica.AAC.6